MKVMVTLTSSTSKNTMMNAVKKPVIGEVSGRTNAVILSDIDFLGLRFERRSAMEVFTKSGRTRSQSLATPQPCAAFHSSRHWSRKSCAIAGPYSWRWAGGYADNNQP